MRKRRRKFVFIIISVLATSFILCLLFSACTQVSYVVQFTSVGGGSLWGVLPSITTADGDPLIPCKDKYRKEIGKCEVIDVAIVCGGAESTRRLGTLVKSLLFHRRNPIHFHFLIDSSRTQLVLHHLFDTWNLPNVNVSFYSINLVESEVSWIPNRHYSGIFGLLKLTLPSVLPMSLNRVLVVDTDILFVSDIAELWNHWFNFDRQGIGLVENLSNWYLGKLWKAHKPWPAIGRGFNTGVILMNLQVLRSLDWMNLWKQVAERELRSLRSTALADQDIFNAVLKDHPELLYRLPCEWNLQLGDHSEQELCHSDVSDLKIVHWNSPNKMKVKSRYAEFFRRHYQTFLEMDGNLLRREIMKCVFNASSKATPSMKSSTVAIDGGAAVDSSAYTDYEDDGCFEFRMASRVVYRTHLYYSDYSYTPKSSDVSLVAQLSLERLQMLLGVIGQWEGPGSIALYLSDAEARQFTQFLQDSPLLSRRKDIAYHIVYKEGAFFPVNYLRNIALEYAETSYVYMSDIDFLPSYGLYDVIRQAIGAQKDMNRIAFVVPAFETQRYRFSFPKSKAELLNGLDTGQLFIFRQDVWTKGHAPTDYDRWRTAYSPYPVSWSTDFEPYIVVQRDGLPYYDTRFMGFGWNKVSHIMELDAIGFDFIVLPNAFMIHLPHAPSFEIAKYRSSHEYRRCLKGLKGEFMKDLAKKYTQHQTRILPYNFTSV